MKKCSFFAVFYFLISTTFTYGMLQDLDAFELGNSAYNEGSYKKAIDFYESILKEGKHSDALYFNLGNAYYKLDDIANSIFYYEKALLLNPEDAEVKENLSYAQNMAIDSISDRTETGLSSVFEQWVYKFTLTQWATASIAFMGFFVLCYVLFLMGSNAKIKRFSFTLSSLFLLLSMFSFGMGYSHKIKRDSDRPAIVFQVSKVQAEPNDRGADLFNLHPGTKVQILDELGSWYKIEISDGQQGWIQKHMLKSLKDS